jgi:hypothetical protein
LSAVEGGKKSTVSISPQVAMPTRAVPMSIPIAKRNIIKIRLAMDGLFINTSVPIIPN